MNNTNKKSAFFRKRILFGADYGLAIQKQLNVVFCERCETKQGASRAVDLRRRPLATMRLEWISNSFEPRIKQKAPRLCEMLCLERITGLEPATSTLARWRSTK